jgi:hypothetical protein
VAGEDILAFLRVRELTWFDLVLPHNTLAELQALAAGAADGGLVALVSGPAGVGKTIAVRKIAEQLRLDTSRVDCRLLTEHHGEAVAEALPGVLARGVRPHAVLLFHDVEWLFTPGAGGSAGQRLLELAQSRLPPTVLETREPDLVRDGVDGIPHVRIPAPDAAARAELWRRLAWRAHPLADLDVERLAAIPAPGAAIERVLEAAVDEAGGREPDTERLLAALRPHG